MNSTPLGVLHGAADNSTATLERLAASLRSWPLSTVILDGIFEDLEAVLSEYSNPDDEEIEALLLRARGSLMQLMAVTSTRDRDPGPVGDLLGRARDLVSAVPATGCMGPRVLLRRMALAVMELLDRMEPIS
ncbi:DUF6415 family natural product biosynthesis protein [uncultured Streptomyces sp.]|uniref:DUF6415 family natural product biosynthesis protein n=1 Tax=uncultured Streptomyces sp. TaxID=174707 RepID=UPI0026295077|nr:DUF6415 family natural product biosynthesis protein [uncultured Streptomyces sp.]